MPIFYPDLYVKSISAIPLDLMQKLRIKAFILDLDNTLTEWNSNEVSREVIDWFAGIKKDGFKACILSNNREQRVLGVAQKLQLPYIFRAGKPGRRAFNRAIELMQVQREETAVIGDQIFTDILGGNRSGLYTILVMPIARREFPGTKISRILELFVLHRIKLKQ